MFTVAAPENPTRCSQPRYSSSHEWVATFRCCSSRCLLELHAGHNQADAKGSLLVSPMCAAHCISLKTGLTQKSDLKEMELASCAFELRSHNSTRRMRQAWAIARSSCSMASESPSQKRCCRQPRIASSRPCLPCSTYHAPSTMCACHHQRVSCLSCW